MRDEYVCVDVSITLSMGKVLLESNPHAYIIFWLPRNVNYCGIDWRWLYIVYSIVYYEYKNVRLFVDINNIITVIKYNIRSSVEREIVYRSLLIRNGTGCNQFLYQTLSTEIVNTCI